MIPVLSAEQASAAQRPPRTAGPQPPPDRQERSAYLEITSHDLRAPLANIRSYAEIALSGRVGAELPPAVRRALEVIERNTDRALLLVQDFIDSRKGDLDALDLARATVSLGDLWTELATPQLCDRLRERAVGLRVEVAPGLPDVTIDRRRVARVLQLLLDRAAIRAPTGSQVVAFARFEGDGVAVGVSDSGPPLAADDPAVVFDRQAAVLREHQLAAGLALPLARSVARAHGGVARLDQDHATSTVTLRLPIVPGPA